MPDVICLGGGELSKSTHGSGGTDGQRPDSNTPETNDTSAEELSSHATPQGDNLPTAGEDQSTGEASAEEQGDDGLPEPEFIAGPIAFKTSGTFFRDRVAQTLAEQGFETGDVSSLESETPPSDTSETADTRSDSAESTDAAAEDDSDDGAEPEEPRTERIPVEEPQGSAEPDSEPATEKIPARGHDESVGDPVAAAAAVTETGPATQPFQLPDEDDDQEHTPKDSDEPRTEAMPAPAPGTVPFAAAPPEAEHRAESGPAGEGTDAETAALWPEPRRLSDYVSDRPSSEDPESSDSESGVPAPGAAAAAATPPGGATPPGAPGGPQGFSGGQSGQQGPAAEHGAGGASGGPGGPKGPPSGPGGPKGPGDKSGKKKKGKKPLWLRLLRAFLVVTGLLIILACGAFAFLYSTVEVPDAAKADAVEQGSTFYFADGETEFAYRGTDRDVITYEEMVAGGDQVVEAVISAEDRGFWTEPGVSLSGTMRAVWSTVTGEQVQGGSTVTQQMVRNYYEGVSLEQTVSRKIQEIIISIKVDQSEDKEWVMEQYLNTIYFGRQSYGVQAAAQAYYNKDVDEITPEEAAFLAAAIQQPTHFGQADVETTPGMENRWQYVVDGMVTTGAITQAEADAMEFPAPEPEKTVENISGYRGYMLQEAMGELADLGFTEDHIQRQGYKIVTTFDEDMMDAAYEAVEEMVPPENLPEGVNIGLTTIDPKTGEVLAFYGGHDYVENQYDSSFLGAAQAGSAFKPYVLATALEQGYGLNSTVDGRGPRDIAGSRVQNAGNAPGGVMTLTQATTVSNNLGFVELAQEVGFEEVRQTAYDVGLPDGSIGDNQLVPVMPLGATSVRPVDQASGYATFANGGVHMEAHVIKEVVNQEGENERPEIEGGRALEESTASDVTYALEQAVNGGTGTAARLWDHPVAGKTGTTDGSVAAWFVGYTPQLSTAVGVYSGNNESFSIPGHNISGGGLPASMWNSYMSRAMEGYERESFPSPEFGGNTENWAPDPATQQPQEPREPQEPQQPENPEPEVPVEPEIPVEPEVPVEPEDPGGPGETEEPGIPEFPPGRGDEG
ncbi:transglycosylase domain-containing protein [Nocardiopsis exhalans]|uniref:Transglycosylase domain-containing protein n=1 Tax=Nocardiopsis exhalans TaxID=163604 RepID=A0ABY5DDK4_9ACTN|nr:transglycosylase domain-containing protein [Nocardiopsis exhalans]USY21573.1 transglycosylase domain-containing protein [Nocardiopsis exhalans]